MLIKFMSKNNCIQKNDNCQVCTPDREIKERFEPKKLLSLQLAESYERLEYLSKSQRVYECGSFLEFEKENNSSIKLNHANFCRDRLCPMCSWRRSYKIFGQVSQVMDCIGEDYDFLFLTLTVPNCTAENLSNLISKMQKAWTYKLCRNKKFKRVVKGYFKALEVTHNLDANSSSYDTYHPHYHCILAVNKSYFKSRDYIQRDEWLSIWQDAMEDKSITQVDIRRCKSKKDILQGNNSAKSLSSAVAEVAKYSVKSKDYLNPNIEITDNAVRTLIVALSNRRLCTFSGCFEKARKQLNLDDVMDGDLIHINESLRSDVALQIYRYRWSTGVYKLIEVDINIKD